MTLVLRVGGVDECLRAFADLPRTIQNRHMRIAMNAGAGVIRDAAVANAPKETGLLKRSLKIKVKVPNASYNAAHHGRPAYAVIGPQRRVVGVKTYTKSGKARKGIRKLLLKPGQKLATTLRRPSRYAHLVERGTKRGVKATHFLARAVASAGPAAQAKVIAKLREGLNQFVQTRRSRQTAAMGV